MVVLNIAVIGSDDLAKSIAKAADQRDVHTYVHKENGPDGARILSLIRPAKYPERLPPFLNALSTSQAGIVEVTAVDANLGEVLVAFASAGITRGLAVINPPEGQWVDETQVKMLFDQAGLADWTFEALVLRFGTQRRTTSRAAPSSSIHPSKTSEPTFPFRLRLSSTPVPPSPCEHHRSRSVFWHRAMWCTPVWTSSLWSAGWLRWMPTVWSWIGTNRCSFEKSNRPRCSSHSWTPNPASWVRP